MNQAFQELTELMERLDHSDATNTNPQFKSELSKIQKDVQQRKLVFQEAMRSYRDDQKDKIPLDVQNDLSQYKQALDELEKVRLILDIREGCSSG